LAAKSSALSIGQQDREGVRAGDHRTVVLRVQILEFLERHLGELRRHLDVDLAVHLDDGEVRRVRNVGQVERVLLRVATMFFTACSLGR
jgi:hypothetical protein